VCWDHGRISGAAAVCMRGVGERGDHCAVINLALGHDIRSVHGCGGWNLYTLRRELFRFVTAVLSQSLVVMSLKKSNQS
jgi:hypothetical protein